jgi:proteic killer suppression protein
MLEPSRIKSKNLKRYFTSDDARGLNDNWVPRIKRILNALDVSVSAAELDMPGWHWHELKGNRRGTFSVLVSGNWRVTYKWEDDAPSQVDLEDYHGR